MHHDTSFDQSSARGRRRRHRIGAIIAVAAAMVAASSCDNVAGPTDGVVGLYTLLFVNNSTVPVIIDQATGYTREIIGGSVSMNADGTFRDLLATRETTNGAVVPHTDTIVGTYARLNTLITFSAAADNSQWNATFSGTGLTEILSGFTLVYRK
jgi:hypothetical protein